MNETTLEVIRSGLKTDPSLTPADRARLMTALRSGAILRPKDEAPPADNTPRLLRRAEVARRLGCSLRTVDKLPLHKVRLPGRKRAAGFLEADVNSLLM